MLSSVRFDRPSAGLTLRALLKRTRGALWTGLAFAVALHGGSTRIRVLAQVRRVAKPLTTQFVKRQPRLTKPLELKKRPQPRRRALRRTMVVVEARADRGRRPAEPMPARVMEGLARPRVGVSRAACLDAQAMEPKALAQAIQGSREAKEMVDLSLEMLDIQALDTGEYHALVVHDPHDKRNLGGFCHLAVAYSERLYAPWSDPNNPLIHFETYFLPGFLRLADVMNQCTDIKTDVLGVLNLDDTEILKAPWLAFFGMFRSFRLTASELENVGRYLGAGGFVLADCQGYSDHKTRGDYGSLRNALLGALATQGVGASFEKLPNSHSIYHCYFDFNGPPIGVDGPMSSKYPNDVHIVPYTEGIEIEGRLLALFSRKGYAHSWTAWASGRSTEWADYDPTQQLRFGVNTIVFALTQGGSITHRLMESME